MPLTIDTELAIAGIALSLLATALALPPLLQMLCGRHKFNLGVTEFSGSDGKAFLVTIKNEIVQSRILKCFGVVREAAEVMAFFDIREQGTNKFIAKDASGSMTCAPTKEQGLLVRALPGFTVGFQILHFKEKAYIVDARAENLKSIGEGAYLVDAQIICGQKVHKLTRAIKVGDAAHTTFWC